MRWGILPLLTVSSSQSAAHPHIPLSTALGAVARPPCPPWGSVGSGGFWGCRIHFRGCFCAVLGFLGSEPLLELGSRVLRVPGVPLSPPMVPCTRMGRLVTYVLLVRRVARKHRFDEAPRPGVTVVFLTFLVVVQGEGGGVPTSETESSLRCSRRTTRVPAIMMMN